MASPIRTRQPRCFLVYAIAPKDMSAAQANQEFNELLAKRKLTLALSLRAYRVENWETLQKQKRPIYGAPRLEEEKAAEDGKPGRSSFAL